MGHFDLIAPWYDRLSSFDGRREFIERLALPVRGWLLDAGGGTGRVAEALHGQAGGIVVADLSMGMLRQAAGKDGLAALRSSAAALPVPDGAFERILMVDAFHHVAEQRRVLAELWRALAPGGRLAVVEPDIRRPAVRLIALAEKLLLMRSHFVAAEGIAALLAAPEAAVSIARAGNTAWVTFDKPT